MRKTTFSFKNPFANKPIVWKVRVVTSRTRFFVYYFAEYYY
ncbi:hypothetical protein [Campylobacter sp.]|nr:hypothetical protein [Campylobacter sp.]